MSLIAAATGAPKTPIRLLNQGHGLQHRLHVPTSHGTNSSVVVMILQPHEHEPKHTLFSIRSSSHLSTVELISFINQFERGGHSVFFSGFPENFTLLQSKHAATSRIFAHLPMEQLRLIADLACIYHKKPTGSLSHGKNQSRMLCMCARRVCSAPHTRTQRLDTRITDADRIVSLTINGTVHFQPLSINHSPRTHSTSLLKPGGDSLSPGRRRRRALVALSNSPYCS